MVGLILSLTVLSMNVDEARKQAAELEARIRAKFQSFSFRAEDCGAVGDGEVDDTRAIQQCIDSLPDFAVLDGDGKRYRVSQLRLKSKMAMRRFAFIKMAGWTDMSPVVNVDGRAEPKSDIVLDEIPIDGQRRLEQGMTTPSAEDGGRHCFRLVGQISNLVLAGVQGNFCGTDGLQLGGMHSTGSDAADELPIQNVIVRNSSFEWNRRTGIAFEGVHNLYLLEIRTRSNGRSLEEYANQSSGSYCAHVHGECFGTGIWTENDHDAAGGSFDAVYLVNVESTENYTRSFYAYSQSGPKVAGFRPKSGLYLFNSTFDAGVAPIAGNPIAIQFSSSSPDGAGAVYRGVQILGCRISGTVNARSIEGLTLTNSVVASPFLGFLEFFDNVTISGVQSSGNFLSSLWLRPDGSPGAGIQTF